MCVKSQKEQGALFNGIQSTLGNRALIHLKSPETCKNLFLEVINSIKYMEQKIKGPCLSQKCREKH